MIKYILIAYNNFNRITEYYLKIENELLDVNGLNLIEDLLNDLTYHSASKIKKLIVFENRIKDIQVKYLDVKYNTRLHSNAEITGLINVTENIDILNYINNSIVVFSEIENKLLGEEYYTLITDLLFLENNLTYERSLILITRLKKMGAEQLFANLLNYIL